MSVASLMWLAVQSKHRIMLFAELRNEWSEQHCFWHVAQIDVEVFQHVWHILGTSKLIEFNGT